MIFFDCPLFAWIGEHLCHVSIILYKTRTFHSFTPSPREWYSSASVGFMLFTHILAPDCIATLLEFSSSGMPVSVLCRDHEYTATYSIQVLSTCKCQEGKKKECNKSHYHYLKKKKRLKLNCRCAWHLKALWSHTVHQHVIICICMQKKKYSCIWGFVNVILL